MAWRRPPVVFPSIMVSRSNGPGQPAHQWYSLQSIIHHILIPPGPPAGPQLIPSTESLELRVDAFKHRYCISIAANPTAKLFYSFIQVSEMQPNFVYLGNRLPRCRSYCALPRSTPTLEVLRSAWLAPKRLILQNRQGCPPPLHGDQVVV